ncbi:unnamed protein product [Clavelina lepadiformis]|uniref:Reverse transcriptase domain-containing protein n=1 Tax=Clavelina lepadiformis TaxID=159417 RepID=A0ABP0FJ87_CLALP
MYQYVDGKLPTVLAGDFNIVDDLTLDKHPLLRNRYKKTELMKLCETYDLKDHFREIYGQKKIYTWQNGISKSRIDRFYLSKYLHATEISQQPSHLTDHEKITINLNVVAPPPRGIGLWKNNTQTYADKEFLEVLECKWKQWCTLQEFLYKTPSDWWTDTKRRLKALIVEFTKGRHAERKMYEDYLVTNLKSAQSRLGDNPANQRKYVEAKRELRNYRKKRIYESILKNRESKEKIGSREFFAHFNKKLSQTYIEEIYDKNGLPTSVPGEMLRTTKNYYTKLYSSRKTDVEIQDLFISSNLRHISHESALKLHCEISNAEIQNVVKTLANGKSPGPDGLSGEFYKTCWNIIGDKMSEIFKHWFKEKKIPKEIKKGAITLIYKKGDDADLDNYRPITLLNLDYKIYTKILANRIRETLKEVIHEHQYATKGKQLSEATILLRDLHENAKRKMQNLYFLSLDFKKAFDSIEHNWLMRVLTEMRFPETLCACIRDLYSDSVAKIILNGHLSKDFKLNRGVRQGDPLSLHLFLIAVEPLMSKLNETAHIKGPQLSDRKEVKCVNYADDTTLCLKNPADIHLALDLVDRFSKASGLTLNEAKTKGLAVNQPVDNPLLPKLSWTNTSIELLGYEIGNVIERQQWENLIPKVKEQLKSLSTNYATYEAKAVLLKSKILPVITQVAKTYPPDQDIIGKLNNHVLQYVQGKETAVSIDILQRNKLEGGYRMPNIQVYADLTYVKSIQKYCLGRVMNEPMSTHDRYVGYQLGHVLANVLDVQKLNNIPHIAQPSPYYWKIREIVEKYKLSKVELASPKLGNTYSRIIKESTPETQSSEKNRIKWARIHNPLLPNYLKTFNYRCAWNLLPFRGKYGIFQINSDTSCAFCGIGPDTDYHTFRKCDKIKRLWVTVKMFAQKFANLNPAMTKIEDLESFNFKRIENEVTDQTLSTLITMVKHQIWKTRNKFIYENKSPPTLDKLVTSIDRAFKYRLNQMVEGGRLELRLDPAFKLNDLMPP